MENYKDLYFKLFAAVADAVESLENNEPIAAKKKLMLAMLETEEAFIRLREPETAQTI